ncbi:uncharacterized protein LOC108741246 [Agrilus planipennis]|uniref:Uncharacterized protein LOC108741246 n=1 Tax=Agrilus planipennis TaxID=224129 RepID=A0A7F5RCP6_AGRPL|nr:uncharacterized protein LOC108741246 [Agrilus planipennis]
MFGVCDLTVTDDTVLEEHNVDPTLVQMRLIGDGVVESIMRGENVGITPRRSRSTAVLQAQQHHHHHNNRQQQHLPITGRILGSHRGIASTGQLAPVANKRSTPIRVRKRASLSEPVLSRSSGPYPDSTDKGT